MEKYQTIEEYVATEMSDKIVRKSKSPFMGLLILGVGIGFIVLISIVNLGGALSSVCLTLGIIASALGLILTAMSLSKALCYYVYKPTQSHMKQHKCYLSVTDYQHCLDAIGDNNLATIGTVIPVTSTNSALNLLYSRDHAIALLQAGRYDSGHFEPETPVVRFTGTEVTHIQALCK